MTSEGDAVAAADLSALKEKVEALSNQIRDLKASGTDDAKDKIPPLVKEMLAAKKAYADGNNGIGVDGKPYEEPLSKSEKKKREKAAKAAAAAAAGGEGGELKADPDSKGSQKKAAKKAEKAAKKAAAKAAAKGGAPPPAAAAASAAAPAGGKAGKAAASAKNKQPARPSPVAFGINTKSKIPPHTLSFNPNAALTDRPVMALAVAVLTNTAQNYGINSDHTRASGPGLGLPKPAGAAAGVNGGEVCGDVTIARYVARRAAADAVGYGSAAAAALLTGAGGDDAAAAAIEQWVDYATSLSRFSLARRVRAVSSTLNAALAGRTYAVGSSLTLADLALFAAMGFPSQHADQRAVLDVLGGDAAQTPTYRWMTMLGAHPAIREATQLAVGITQLSATETAEAAFGPAAELDPLVSGMSPLQGACPGSVVTRFPPEPSGYLHIGHAKAVLMNEYYARRYKGRLIARFDDTNPSKEKEEFQASILEDLGKLGVKPDVVTFTSDYFETIRQYALYMIKNGA
jgi:hypothetical protein